MCIDVLDVAASNGESRPYDATHTTSRSAAPINTSVEKLSFPSWDGNRYSNLA